MTIPDKEKIVKKLEEVGLEEVKRKLSSGAYAPQKKVDIVKEWVLEQESEAQEKKEAPTYMYHPKIAPQGKVFKAYEVPELERNGWYDSPSKFPEKNQFFLQVKSFWLEHWKFIITTIIVIAGIYFAYIKG